MLVFDDASIARVIRAAREVPFKRRRRWLADIAKRFERKRAPSPGAHYTRRSRAKAKAGLAVLKAVVEEVPLVLALIDLKFLNPDVADDPEPWLRGERSKPSLVMPHNRMVEYLIQFAAIL